MSVIFQALQKLDPAQENMDLIPGGVDQSRFTADGAPRSLPRFAKSAVFAVLIVGLGFGAVYGVGWLGPKAARAPLPESEPVRHTLPKAVEKDSEPAAGAGMTEKAATPARAQYYPPEPRGPAVDAKTNGPGKISAQPLPGDAPKDAHRATPRDTIDTIDAADAIGLSGLTASKQRGDKPALPQVRPTLASRSTPDKSTPETPPPPDKDEPQTRSAHIDPGWQAAERARLAAREKKARIETLVRRIEVSINASGHGQDAAAKGKETDALLATLARYQGRDSVYVAKLKAYRLIKAGQYDKAEPLLEKILAVHATDLEAGLNMAVILINTGRLQQAAQRLKHLREIFPANGAVADLLLKLPPRLQISKGR